MVPGDEIKYLSTLPQSANTNRNVLSASAASRCPIMTLSYSSVPASYDAQAMYESTGHS